MSALTPGSPEWARRVSPSKAAAILGLSPWDSPRAMWHKMRGDVPWDAETPAMERGNLCEPAVLAWWRKHHEHTDWREQVTLTVEDWCVATPDALATHRNAPVLVEAKTSTTADEWGRLGPDDIPLYYLTQVYLSMHICHLNGIEVEAAHVPVLGGRRLEFSNYVIPYSAEHGARVLDLCREFYDTLGGEAPDLDDSVATYDAVRILHPEIDAGDAVELTRKEARDLVEWVDEIKHTEASVRRAKATVLDRMGRAQYATYQGVRIARRQNGRSGVSFVVTAKPDDITELEQTA